MNQNRVVTVIRAMVVLSFFYPSSSATSTSCSPHLMRKNLVESLSVSGKNSLTAKVRVQHLISYAFSFIKTPYEYGGKSAVVGGLDCSGYVSEILRAAGEVGNKEQLNAQGLFEKFMKIGTPQVLAAGALAFYGTDPNHITHVAFMIDQYRIIEAGGGYSETRTPSQADANNAMVRVRLLNYRGDLIQTIKPRYAKIGLF